MSLTDPAYRQARDALLWANGYAAGIKCAGDAVEWPALLAGMLSRAERGTDELEAELAILRAAAEVTRSAHDERA